MTPCSDWPLEKVLEALRDIKHFDEDDSLIDAVESGTVPLWLNEIFAYCNHNGLVPSAYRMIINRRAAELLLELHGGAQ
jgi:hypothetical protein